MSSFNWESFLKRWSQEMILAIVRDEGNLPPAVLRSGWLGYPGATEQQLTQAEARLETSLPSSYRAFLKVSNGWQRTSLFSNRLWPTADIEWFAVRNQAWIRAFSAKFERPAPDTNNAKVDTPSVPDADYFIYGDAQDCSQIRLEYLQTALEISQPGDGAIYLLNPQIVTPDGEWEAWFFGDWLPGADRYLSFQDMMQAEYESFLELHAPLSPPVNIPLQSSAQASPNRLSSAPVMTESPPSGDAKADEWGEDYVSLADDPVNPAAKMTDDDWRQLATFMIHCQIRQQPHAVDLRSLARHIETDITETRSDIDMTAIQQWMRGQLTAVTEPNQPSKPLALAITQLKVIPQLPLKLSGSKAAESWPPDAIAQGAPFAIEVAMNFEGTERAIWAKRQLVCRARCVAHHLATRLDVDLGDITTPLSQDAQATYKAQFPKVQLQQPGLYRLKVWVTLQNLFATPGYFKLPMLLVV